MIADGRDEFKNFNLRCYNYDISADQGMVTEVVGYLGKQKKPDEASQGARVAPNSSGWCVIL
jgi:hypothetical protein